MRKIYALLFTFILLIVNGCGGDNIPEPGSELRDFEFAWQAADTFYAHFEQVSTTLSHRNRTREK